MRVALFVLPLVVAWFGVRLVADWFYRPEGWTGVVIWMLQAMVVGTVIAMMVDRWASRFVPLTTLLGMSLTFPDQAPSRFSVALRAGTLSQLQSRIDEFNKRGFSHDANEAAHQAVEMITLLGRHERMTRGHTERVRAFCEMIGEEMKLSEDQRQKLRWAALLHDIGKLTVPSEILNKSEKLTDDEWRQLKNHPRAGGVMVEPLAGWLGEWRLAASQHHERWDGAGYPAGLAGEQISLAGRIVAVADAYDVITSHRAYKEPMTADVARQELVKCSGTQFDPVVVRAMVNAALGRRRSAAGLAWLLEMPRVGNLVNGLAGAPAMVVASVMTVGASMAGTVPEDPPPTDLAMVAVEEEIRLDTAAPAEGAAIVAASEEVAEETVDPPVDEGEADAPVAPDAGQQETSTTLAGAAQKPSRSTTTSVGSTSSSVTSTTSGSRQTSTTRGTTAATSTTTVRRSTTAPTTAAPVKTTTTVRRTTTTRRATTAPTTATTRAPTTTATTRAPTTTTTRPPTTTTTTTAPTTTTTAVSSDCARLQSGDSVLIAADLEGCDLSGQSFNLVDLSFADLDGADLTGATFSRFNLNGASLEDATLTGASFTDGSMVGAIIGSVNASGLTLVRVDMARVNLADANLRDSTFEDVSFGFAVLSGALLGRSTFTGTNFNDADLTGADFVAAVMPSTEFYRTTAIGANFTRVDARQSRFDGANVTSALFNKARMDNTGLTLTRLTDTVLVGTNFTAAWGPPLGTSTAQYSNTVCPDGSVRNTSCW